MDEVARFMDWDLQAIVKGISTSEEAPVAAAATIIDNNSPHHHQQDLFFNFHEFSETTWVIDELEELYKPLYPVPENNSSISTVTSSLLAIPEEQVKVLKPPAASKSKRRKKNGKRRVKEVTEAEAYSDGWAWRKYGQKPIKGSPYPRSYYRCSSSKGCLCRKQVERSPFDPQVFIVTYTAAEHTHPQPTRRKYSSSGPTRNNNNNKNSTSSSMIIAAASSSRAVEDHGGHVRVPSVGDEEQSNNNRGEDADSGNWLQNIELEEELNGLDLDDQLLDFDGCGFMDTTFDDDTWFNSSIDLT